MNNIDFTIFPSAFDTKVKPENQYSVPWDKLAKKLQTPTIVSKKEDAKLLVPASFNTKGKRNSDDLITYSALCLDVDDNYHPLVFIKQDFPELEYVVYSSFNHNLNKKTQEVDPSIHKFRVIIPLKEPITVEQLRTGKDALMKTFPGVDPASFTPSQGFYLPSITEDRKDTFFSHHNKGEVFDFASLNARIFALQAIADVAAMRRPMFQSTQNSLDDVADLLNKTSPDCPYDVWVKLGMALKSIFGEDAYAVWQKWSETGSSYDSTESKMQSKWRGFRSDGEWSYGYFINRQREFPN
jgi:hypothetical protein